METEFLKTLLQVAEQGSMAQAARSLNLTPAAVAHQLQALEKGFGAALVTRAGRTVALTPAGHQLLQRSRQLLADIDRIKHALSGANEQALLKLGAINTALHSFLPDLIKQFSLLHPQAQLHIQAGVSPQLMEFLQDDRIDLAICQLPPYSLPKLFGWQPVHEEPLVVMAPRPLAKHDPLMLLRTQPFIRYDRRLGGGRQAETFLRAHDIMPLERYELDSLLSIAMMVDKHMGVSLVPMANNSLVSQLDVASLPLPDSTMTRSFGAIWKRSSPRADLLQSLVGLLRDYHHQHHGAGGAWHQQ
ncbi:MAG: LysR substrate-binding domain-containing protein [Pigmentiphaga sp.]